MKYFLFYILFSILSSFGFSQFSSVGTNFSVVFLQNRIDSLGQPVHPILRDVHLLIYVTNNSNSIVNVNINFNGNGNFNYIFDNNFSGPVPGPNTSFNIQANKTTEILIYPNNMVSFYDDYDHVNATITDIRDYQMMGNGTRQNKMFSIIADKLISVYAESCQPHSRDACLILPNDILGTHYYVMAYEPDKLESGIMANLSDQFGGPSEFTILAVETGTTSISVQFPQSISVIQTNLYDTIIYPITGGNTLTLNQGEAIQFQSDDYDLTGTEISSSQNIAVFSGNMAVGLPQNTRTFDHLFEQMFPTSKWGIKYVTIPLETEIHNNTLTDIFKIISAKNNTSIKINDSTLIDNFGNNIILNSGDYLEFSENYIFKNGDYSSPLQLSSNSGFLNPNSPNIIEGVNSTVEPTICIAQYSASCGIDDSSGGTADDIDPFMTLLTPINQGIRKITFSVGPKLKPSIPPTNCNCDYIKKDYVAITSKTSEINYIYIDNLNGFQQELTLLQPNDPICYIGSGWHQIPNTNLSYIILDISNDSLPIGQDIGPSKPLRLYNPFPDSKGFNAYLYGYNCRESYGYSLFINLYNDSTINILNKTPSKSVKIYPNPINKLFTVENNTNYNVKIIIEDILGNKIFTSSFFSKKRTFNIQNLEKGIYLVVIKNETQTILIKKIIKV